MKNKLNTRQYLELKGELVQLKKLDKQYEAVYTETIGAFDTEARICTATGQLFSAGDIAAYMDRVIADSSRIDFLIFTAAAHELVGEVVLADIDPVHRSAHLRIVIAQKEDRNKGYGAEALLLALYYGFGMCQLHRIELEVLSHNRRAAHLYERLGFVPEGTRKEVYYFNHRYHDVIGMAMLAPAFREKYLDADEHHATVPA